MKDEKIRRGALVVITGPDACGKTSQAKMLVERLQAEGHSSLLTCEPWESEYGVRIRERLAGGFTDDPQEMAMLFAMDRLVHLREQILPAIAKGTIVVTTRYVESSLMYNAAEMVNKGVEDGELWVRQLNRLFRRADLYVVLHVSRDTLERRIRERADADHYERDVARQRDVQHAYKALDKRMPTDLIAFVSADEEQPVVANRVWDMVKRGVLNDIEAGA